MTKAMPKWFHKIDVFLDHHLPLLVILALITVLRLPNFFEPYWYGDEGIYLTLGNALRAGQRLYVDIIDHKTPLIYYFAMTPSQIAFRALFFCWMVLTTVVFYHFAQVLLGRYRWAFAATLLFIFSTTLPAFEGHIPNGELFVMGFTLVGALLLAHTQLWHTFFQSVPSHQRYGATYTHPIQQIVSKVLHHTHDLLLFWAAGVAVGLGILTKVPALFEAVAYASVFWLVWTQAFSWLHFRKWMMSITALIIQGLVFVTGIVTPILGSVVYFVLRGSGKAYLDYGLLYNFRYAGSWQLDLPYPFLQFWFTLPGKFLIVLAIIVVVTALGKVISRSLQFTLIWTALSLFAALLSNRPYPHYFLQIFPAATLLITVAVRDVIHATSAKRYAASIFSIALPAAMIALFVQVGLWLGLGLYPTLSYYQRFTALATGKLSWVEYRNSFDYLMADNYAAAPLITPSRPDGLYIWGTNPMLYAQTKTYPVGRFTVSFHIKDFNAYQETLADIQAGQPEFIVVMNNETPLPGLDEYLRDKYIANNSFHHFVLWKKF